MSEIVSAVTSETLEQVHSATKVTQIMAEVPGAAPNKPLHVHAATIEHSLVQPNRPVAVHATQVEYVWTKTDPVAHVNSATYDILHPQDSQAAVHSVFVEVLRTVVDKKRRGPTLVVAN